MVGVAFICCTFVAKIKCHLACLRTRITILSDLKHITKLKEIPRDGVNQCIQIARNDL